MLRFAKSFIPTPPASLPSLVTGDPFNGKVTLRDITSSPPLLRSSDASGNTILFSLPPTYAYHGSMIPSTFTGSQLSHYVITL